MKKTKNKKSPNNTKRKELPNMWSKLDLRLLSTSKKTNLKLLSPSKSLTKVTITTQIRKLSETPATEKTPSYFVKWLSHKKEIANSNSFKRRSERKKKRGF